MPIDDREQQFERALARHLREASGGCPDSEILAAYHERMLSLEEMAKWKEHIAGCERCQEALSLVEQTETPGSEAWKTEDGALVPEQWATGGVMPAHAAGVMKRVEEEVLVFRAPEKAVVVPMSRRRVNWKWIAPIGAVAAGILVWIGAMEMEKRNHAATETVDVADNRRAADAPGMRQLQEPQKKEPERKQLEDEKKLKNEDFARPTRSDEIALLRPEESQTSKEKKEEVAGQLNKKKDETGEAGNGRRVAIPEAPSAAPAPPMLSADTSKNQAMRSEERDALVARAPVSGAVGGVAGAKPAPAASGSTSSDRARSLAASKSTEGYVESSLSTITGAVLDPSGAAVSGAVITAVDTKTGSTKTAVSDGEGKFQLNDLSPDQYRVTVAQKGFEQSEQVVALQPEQKEQLDVRLKLGTTAQSIEVTAGATALNTSSAEVQTGQHANALMLLAAANPQYIVAPDKKVGWRVGGAGKIEKSVDHGKTWKEQTSGVSADLRTGSAASGAVCWIVGKAGTVLLTTDGGKHWKQIASPMAEDLGGVHAVDGEHATIWDVANRKSFETSDGGATWKRTANE